MGSFVKTLVLGTLPTLALGLSGSAVASTESISTSAPSVRDGLNLPHSQSSDMVALDESPPPPPPPPPRTPSGTLGVRG